MIDKISNNDIMVNTMNPQDFKKLLKEELTPLQEKINRLDKIEERIEDILVDKHRNRLDIMSIRTNTQRLQTEVEVLKLDIEKVKSNLEEAKKEAKETKKDLITLIEETAKNVTKDIASVIGDVINEAVSQKEFKQLEQRVIVLEQL